MALVGRVKHPQQLNWQAARENEQQVHIAKGHPAQVGLCHLHPMGCRGWGSTALPRLCAGWRSMALPRLQGLGEHGSTQALPRLFAHSTVKQTELLAELPAPGSECPPCRQPCAGVALVGSTQQCPPLLSCTSMFSQHSENGSELCRVKSLQQI